MMQKTIATGGKSLPVKAFIEKNSLGSWSKFRSMSIKDQNEIMLGAKCYKKLGERVHDYLHENLGAEEAKELYSPASRLRSIVHLTNKKALKTFWDNNKKEFAAAIRCVSASDRLRISESIAIATGRKNAASAARSKLDGMILNDGLDRLVKRHENAENREGRRWGDAVNKLAAQERPVDLSRHVGVIDIIFEASQCMLGEIKEHNNERVSHVYFVGVFNADAWYLAKKINDVIRALKNIKTSGNALPEKTKNQINGWVRELSDMPIRSYTVRYGI